MKIGLFTMPLHPPEKNLTLAYDEDLELLAAADHLGLSEAWVGEHFTSAWENVPAPDLFIARALGVTKRIALGTGVALLPFHSPVILAHRIAALDHLAHGRLLFGIGAGGLPTDHELFGVDERSGQHRRMMREAIEAILKVWTDGGPVSFHGEFFKFDAPAPRPDLGLSLFLRPYQKPHPPIAVAGVTPGSDTLEWAGERGWIPMSINFLHPTLLPTHWQAVERGAARSGLHADRRQWRIVREVYVADTTERARREVMESSMRTSFDRYFRSLLSLGPRGLSVLKPDSSVPDEAITPQYMLENLWIVGDPAECASHLRQLQRQTGGFGTLLVICHDWDNKQRWLHSLELLATRVMPAVAGL